MSNSYLRYGEIPPNEKSINWYKVKLDDQRDFSWALEAYGIEDAYRMIRNLDEAFENGVSVFELDENDNPILNTEELVKDYERRKGTRSYIVTGDKIGVGNSGEPLIINIQVLQAL